MQSGVADSQVDPNSIQKYLLLEINTVINLSFL